MVEIGFPEAYDRARAIEQINMFASPRKRDWITPVHGPGLTGYDFQLAVTAYLHATGNSELSLAEVWLHAGRRGVGKAARFISHAQKQQVQFTLGIEPDPAGAPFWASDRGHASWFESTLVYAYNGLDR